jgi:hypothetical protein
MDESFDAYPDAGDDGFVNRLNVVLEYRGEDSQLDLMIHRRG